ncbi:MAG TPA: hypothetical protein VEQ60_12420, partial [Longimicrobium sp.]|nr:hypothetical protein [Longimicrobium sp.]
MDTAELQAIIRQQLASPPFTVSGALLESPDVTTLFTAFFGADSFVLDGAQSSDDLVVSGTMTQPLVGLTKLQAVATFSVADNTAQVSVALDALPEGWTPSDTFPQLAGSVFDQFSWTSPALELSSTPPPLPPDFPVGFGYSPYSPGLVAAEVPGLALTATIAPLPQFTGSLEWLL